MIGSIIGAGIGALGSIFGGISASKAMKRARQEVEAQRRKNDAWHERRYNEDATQRADAQRILTMTSERLKAANRAAAGQAAVMGGTEESVAATKAANAQAMADAAGNIAAQAESRKDAIEQEHQAKDEQYSNQLAQIQAGKAQAIGQAVQGVGQAAAQIGSGLDEYWEKPAAAGAVNDKATV